MVRIYNNLRKRKSLKAFNEWKNGFIDPRNMVRTFHTTDRERTDVLGLYRVNLSSDFTTSNFVVYLCKVKISLCIPWRRTVEWRFSATHPVTAERHSVKSASESEWTPHPVRKLWRQEKYIHLPEIEPWILGRPAISPYLLLAQSLSDDKRESSKSFWMFSLWNVWTEC